VALLLVFMAWARCTQHPAVDLSLFAERTYREVNLATLTFGIVFAMMFFGFFLFLVQAWHYSLPRAGLAVSPGPLLVVPVAVIGAFARSGRCHMPRPGRGQGAETRPAFPPDSGSPAGSRGLTPS
jgi:hypothetical protein